MCSGCPFPWKRSRGSVFSKGSPAAKITRPTRGLRLSGGSWPARWKGVRQPLRPCTSGTASVPRSHVHATVIARLQRRILRTSCCCSIDRSTLGAAGTTAISRWSRLHRENWLVSLAFRNVSRSPIRSLQQNLASISRQTVRDGVLCHATSSTTGSASSRTTVDPPRRRVESDQRQLCTHVASLPDPGDLLALAPNPVPFIIIWATRGRFIPPNEAFRVPVPRHCHDSIVCRTTILRCRSRHVFAPFRCSGAAVRSQLPKSSTLFQSVQLQTANTTPSLCVPALLHPRL